MSKQLKTNKKKIAKLESKIKSLMAGVAKLEMPMSKDMSSFVEGRVCKDVPSQVTYMTLLNTLTAEARSLHDRRKTALAAKATKRAPKLCTLDDPITKSADDYTLAA